MREKLSGISVAEKIFTQAIAITSANTQAAALILISDKLSCKTQPGKLMFRKARERYSIRCYIALKDSGTHGCKVACTLRQNKLRQIYT